MLDFNAVIVTYIQTMLVYQHLETKSVRYSFTDSCVQCSLKSCTINIRLTDLTFYVFQISTKFKPDLGLKESTFPKINTDNRFVFAEDFKPNLGIDENPIPDEENQEPSRRRRYWIESRCSGMFVRIKPGTRRNSIDASGKKTPPGRYSKCFTLYIYGLHCVDRC